MAITRPLIIAMNPGGTAMREVRIVAIKLVDESVVSGSLVTWNPMISTPES